MGLEQTSSEELMRLVQAGDEQAMTILYDRHHSGIWNYLQKRFTKSQAQDLFQDFFLKLIEKKDLWNGQPVIAWMFVILRHLCIDEWRKQSRWKMQELGPELSEQQEVQEFFDDLLVGLDEDQRKLLKDHYQLGKSYQELAIDYGLNEANIRKKVSRLLADLRGRLSGT